MRRFTAFIVCLFFAISQLAAQTRVIKGKVTDDKGAAIGNASVQVKGSRSGTVTDENGNFSLTVPSSAKALVVSSLNFTQQEVSINGQSNISVKLDPTSGKLDEVVVVGFGTTKRTSATIAMTKVSAAQVENVPFASVDKILQGKVPGLQSSSSNGQPGANQDVRIRGIGSFTASSSPLYVVDGVQIVSGDFSSAVTTTNVLSTLTPMILKMLRS
jgi:hypothetical protein